MDNLLSLEFPISSIKDAFQPPGISRKPSHMGDLFPTIRDRKEGQRILAWVISQVTFFEIINMPSSRIWWDILFAFLELCNSNRNYFVFHMYKMKGRKMNRLDSSDSANTL